MNREQYIKRMIKERGDTIKDFAADVGIPYSTLLSMLNGSIGTASVENVVRICRQLGITVDNLQQHVKNFDADGDFPITEDERLLITQYRLHTDYQSAVRKLLDIN